MPRHAKGLTLGARTSVEMPEGANYAAVELSCPRCGANMPLPNRQARELACTFCGHRFPPPAQAAQAHAYGQAVQGALGQAHTHGVVTDAIDDLARQLGGRCTSDAEEAASWQDSFWPGPHDARTLRAPRYSTS